MTNQNERKVADTVNNRKFDCLYEARELALYTVKICSNDNTFPLQFYQTMTSDLVSKAKDIYRLGRRANETYISTNLNVVELRKQYAIRSGLQRQAIFMCIDLISDIDIAKSLFKLRGKRVKYWVGMVIKVKSLMIAWYKAEKDKYSKI